MLQSSCHFFCKILSISFIRLIYLYEEECLRTQNFGFVFRELIRKEIICLEEAVKICLLLCAKIWAMPFVVWVTTRLCSLLNMTYLITVSSSLACLSRVLAKGANESFMFSSYFQPNVFGCFVFSLFRDKWLNYLFLFFMSVSTHAKNLSLLFLCFPTYCMYLIDFELLHKTQQEFACHSPTNTHSIWESLLDG